MGGRLCRPRKHGRGGKTAYLPFPVKYGIIGAATGENMSIRGESAMVTYCPYCMCPSLPGQLCPSCGADPAGYHPSSHHFAMGRLLHDRYLVGKVLGEGGFGITYLGLDTTLERRVAIKEYFPNVFVHRESSVSLNVTCYSGEKQTLYEKGREQFLQEARVMARFDYFTEIVHVLDFFPANNTAYIVMELLTGNTLRTLLAQQGRIHAKYLFEMMEPVLRAMSAIHGAGIIHRDISPANIMLLDSGQVKLLDFGCARDIGGDHTMTVMLKHGYAPIEQYTGYNQGPWTDVYALCATFYHCLTGQIPPRALERMTAQDPLIPPNRMGAALTPEQEQAIMRGLEVEPKNRWQSIAGLYAALYDTVIKEVSRTPEGRETELLVEPIPGPRPGPEQKTALLIPGSEPRSEARAAPEMGTGRPGGQPRRYGGDEAPAAGAGPVDDRPYAGGRSDSRDRYERPGPEPGPEENSASCPPERKERLPLKSLALGVFISLLFLTLVFALLSMIYGGAKADSSEVTPVPTETAEPEPEHRYAFVVDGCSWTEAQRKAIEAGGQLACFETREEYELVLRELDNDENKKIEYRIGARRETDGTDYYLL